MSKITINLGEGTRSLRLEPEKTNVSGVKNRYKIYLENDNNAWQDKENIDMEDIPVDALMGTITVRTAKDFTFDGKGSLSGEDLLFIANFITELPAFKKHP